MNLGQAALIAGSGVLAGMINSVAGGGSFLTLPVLVACGIPAVPANATSTVALVPGTLASFGAYRRELTTQPWMARLLALVSVVGGSAGAWVLLNTPVRAFDLLLPWLTLFAVTVFGLGPSLSARLQRSGDGGESHRSLVQTCLVQLAVAIYGGYYGAGAGIMMLAVLAMQGMKDIHAMNALKTLLAASFNSAAVAYFAWRGVVHWPAAFCMMAGAIGGGYGGAWLARQLPPARVRQFVLIVGILTTGYFFWRAYL